MGKQESFNSEQNNDNIYTKSQSDENNQTTKTNNKNYNHIELSQIQVQKQQQQQQQQQQQIQQQQQQQQQNQNQNKYESNQLSNSNFNNEVLNTSLEHEPEAKLNIHNNKYNNIQLNDHQDNENNHYTELKYVDLLTKENFTYTNIKRYAICQKQYMKQKIREPKVNIPLTFVLLAFSYLFYGVFIDPICHYRLAEECIDHVLVTDIVKWSYCIAFCSLIIYYIVYLCITRVFHPINLIPTTIYTLWLIFKNGSLNIGKVTISDYRTGFSLGVLSFLILIAFFHFLFKAYQFIYRRYKKVFMGLMVFYAVCFVLFIRTLYYSCDGWEKGLIHDIEEDGVHCNVIRPSICWPVVFDGYFDLSPDTCKKPFDSDLDKYLLRSQVLKNYQIIDDKSSKKEIDEKLDEIKFIGWPNSKDFAPEQRVDEDGILLGILNNSKYYKTKEEAYNNGHEIIIDVENFDMKVNLQQDKQTLKERRINALKTQSIAENVIVIYIDTVSRAQTLRKLPKTMSFFKKYALRQQNDLKNQSNAKAFEFLRYHSIDRRTYDNVFKMQYDVNSYQFNEDIIELSKDDKKRSFFTDMKDAGYMTGHISNSLSMNSVFRGREYKDEPLYEFFENQPADHEVFLFDPQYVQLSNSFGVQKGANSIKRRCIYNQDTNYFVFEYGKQFLEQYKDDKKFLYLEFTDGHEITSEVIQYIDDNLYNFLITIEKDGHLKSDTMLYFLSDHGQHLLSAFQFYKQFGLSGDNEFFQVERMLPFYYMIVTTDLLNKVENLEHSLIQNQQNIFGMNEFRKTLMSTFYGTPNQNVTNSQNYNQSLFTELNSSNSCLDIGLIPLPNPKEYCSCVPVNGYDNEVNRLDQLKVFQSD